jgi:hypothetical protein
MAALTEFRWIPGQGMDRDRIERLREHFGRPSQPMGQAWFMGEERRMFPELAGDVDELGVSEIQHAVNEIPAGYSAFGPMREWHDWYHYLLPKLLPRAHDFSTASILESLITGFMAIYPNGVYSAPYKTFREDVLLTLGRCMMEPHCWKGSEVVLGSMLHRSNRNPAKVWMWWDASGDFSSSMFFCLKYLPEDLVAGWLRSVLAIPSPHWRGQVIAWAVGAHSFLTGENKWPADINLHQKPGITWEWSHCLFARLATRDDSGAAPMPAFLSDGARGEAMRVLNGHFSDDLFLEWLESLSRDPALVEELGEIPATFERLYVSR